MKTICVPKNQQALARLDTNSSIENDLIEVTLSNEVYSEVERTGLFSVINKDYGTLIDDYEDDSIVDETILNSIVNDQLFEKLSTSSAVKPTILEIKNLFLKAIEYKTGVFFYF
jgi:hypothetical protein